MMVLIAEQGNMTKDEKRNGWTEETLAKYHKEREAARMQKITEPDIVKPDTQSGYNPLKWRG